MNPICVDCGNEMDRLLLPDGDWFWHCEDCQMARAAADEAHHAEMNEPEEYDEYDDTARRDWEYDLYKRLDAEDLAGDEHIYFPGKDDFDDE